MASLVKPFSLELVVLNGQQKVGQSTEAHRVFTLQCQCPLIDHTAKYVER
jgi:hypothetical protein